MELYEIILLIVGVVLFILIGLSYYFKKDYLKYSKLITPIISAFGGVIQAVGNVFPDNKTIQDITTVVSASIKAAGYAENLWLQGEIEKTQRPEYAKQYIVLLLNSSGITVNSNIETIISGVIAITCYLMPHYENKEE